MATKVERITTDGYQDRLLELFKDKTGSDSCSLSPWKYRPLAKPPAKSIEEAPPNTKAVVVDTKNSGAFRIYNRKNDEDYEYLGGAGKDTPLVLICWNPMWVFLCTGTLRFRYIIDQQ
ncbi:hypothetical protein PMIN06_010473 [Paraphaeosphaeria minitans]|uniref:Uncharacterized protein n=1 Tax=Paraphaeosphaeria minitans TaxID=565426 RepID=A0A9P6GEX2_9PLEO|nr:hypothetical protein PMIN01_12191 [Paraphaeosphaeria minitans]KAF9733828.1 hypothetical protein PMIN01_08171 [Paraphaeosphaeria minitans]